VSFVYLFFGLLGFAIFAVVALFTIVEAFFLEVI
jgi:hypothetical protein